jgi:hypothetical protein
MSLNVMYEFQRLGTYLLSYTLPQPSPVREEEASSHFFSEQYIVPRDLALLILDRVQDIELAHMQCLNRKWYWTIVKCPRLMERLSINSFMSSCINAGNAGIEDLRLNVPGGWFSSLEGRMNGLRQIAQATLAIAKVDPRFLDNAKVAAFEVEDPDDAVIAIEDFVKELAQTDIGAANTTALTITDPRVQESAFRVILEVEECKRRNEGTRPAVVVLTGEPLVQLELITAACRGLNYLSPGFIREAQQDLKGAKERALTINGRVERTLALLVIALVDPEHDFYEVKAALKADPSRALLGALRLRLGMKAVDYWIDNLLVEIVNVEVRYHLKDAKETALMIKDPFNRTKALVIVAKAAKSRLNSSAH